jgi:GTP1/Obg family GTP-binding protein
MKRKLSIEVEDIRLEEEEVRISKELAAVKAKRKEIEARKLERHRRVVTDNLDALLALTPDHSCINCSYNNAVNAFVDNGSYRCTRCALLRASEYKYVEFSASVVLRPTGESDE